MKIFVDADACPVVRIVEKIAKKYEVPVMLLCDTNHVLSSDYSEVMIVGAGTYAFRKILGQLKLPSFASFIISYGLYFVILLSINRKRILDCLKEINQFK